VAAVVEGGVDVLEPGVSALLPFFCLASLACRTAAWAAKPAPFLCDRFGGSPLGESESCNGSLMRADREEDGGLLNFVSVLWLSRVVASDSVNVLTIGVEVLEERARDGRGSRSRSGRVDVVVELRLVFSAAGGGTRGDAADLVFDERFSSEADASSRLTLFAPLLLAFLSTKMPPFTPFVPFAKTPDPSSISLSPFLFTDSFIVVVISSVDLPVMADTL